LSILAKLYLMSYHNIHSAWGQNKKKL